MIKNKTLDEKVDELLKYQKRIHHMAVIRAVFSFLSFFVIVVLPIIGIVYIGDYLASNIGLSMKEVGETLKRVKSLTEFGGIDSLKSLIN